MPPVSVTFVSDLGPAITIRPTPRRLSAPATPPAEVAAAPAPAPEGGFDVAGLPDDGQALAGPVTEPRPATRAARLRTRAKRPSRGRPSRAGRR